jgi:hypothetical protein
MKKKGMKVDGAFTPVEKAKKNHAIVSHMFDRVVDSSVVAKTPGDSEQRSRTERRKRLFHMVDSHGNWTKRHEVP